MLTSEESQFLKDVKAAAVDAGHIFPGAAAAEAALESNWGGSVLALKAKNLFGLKKPLLWTGPVLSMRTREFLHDAWVTVPATWPVFATWAGCLKERMNVLRNVGRYAAALQAANAEEYITLVSAAWATDPERGAKVLSIYHSHLDILG